jgi:hypothetical protein
MKTREYKDQLMAGEDGRLMFAGRYYVGFATHPSHQKPSHNAKQRKRHLSPAPLVYYPKQVTLCNMLMDSVEKKLDWDSPMQYVKPPKNGGAGEMCKICYDKAINSLTN